MGVPSWNMGLVFPCYCGDALSGVRNPTKVDFQSPVQPCLVSAVSAHTSCNYSSDHPFYSLSLQGGFTLLRRAPDSSGSDSSAVISHCVFFATRFFINLCCSKQGYFKQSYIKQHMKCLNFCNDFCVKILLLHFLKRTFP
jgi:hypothetical protein